MTSTAAVMVTVKQRRPENAVTRAGAGRGWGEEVSQTTGEGALAILLQSGSIWYLQTGIQDSKAIKD